MGPIGVLALSGGFSALWLISAALFHRSARALYAGPNEDFTLNGDTKVCPRTLALGSGTGRSVSR